MKRVPVVLGTFGTLLFVGSLTVSLVAQQPPAQGQGAGRGAGAPAGAQGGGRGAPQPTQNLQVLPKDFTVQQVIPIMQNVAQALGVGCEHCHNFVAPGSPMNDMASDMKPQKNTARVMMRMVQNINMTLNTQLGKPQPEVTQVGCITCHRGVAIPKQLVDIVVEAGNMSNAAAGIAKYRELRTQYYGSQAYDFSDATLFLAAQRANAANKPDDAIAYAQANLEFNPKSARSYQVMSQAYARKMDQMNAIAMMEKAVATDPMNMQFQNQLNQLKNPGQGRGQGQGGGQGRGQ
jgi:hypothetical protein